MPTHPNLIFIITDDQGYGDIACNGNPWLNTPHLDHMATESVRLDNHHHDPLCSPSRAATRRTSASWTSEETSRT